MGSQSREDCSRPAMLAVGDRVLDVADIEAEAADVVTRIIGFSDGSYQPCPLGIEAVVGAIYDLRGRPFDILALPCSDGRIWYRRTLQAEILGAASIPRSYHECRPVVLVPTPADYGHLVATNAPDSKMACCILDWNADLRRVFGLVVSVRCTSHALARRLERALTIRPPFPIIVGA